MNIMKLANAWQRFQSNHPKFAKFLQEVPKQTLREGAIIEISITTPEGQNYCSNMRITQSDLELVKELQNMTSNRK